MTNLNEAQELREQWKSVKTLNNNKRELVENLRQSHAISRNLMQPYGVRVGG